MRSRIIMLRSEDVPYYLASVLCDVLTSRSKPDNEMRDIDILVDYLDAETVVEQRAVRAPYCEADWAIETQTAVMLKEAKLAAFQRLTRDQTDAVYEWLVFVSGWDALFWDRDILESAKAYWKSRNTSTGAS